MKNIILILVLVFNLAALESSAQQSSVSLSQFAPKANDSTADNSKAVLDALEYAKLNNIQTLLIPEGIFYISRGFNLPDNFTVLGAGINKTTLRLMSGLPPRKDEATQTAIFTGSKSFNLSHTAATSKITIRDLTIDLQKPEAEFDVAKFSMLGGIRLINPVDCLIDSVRIINPQKFGIGLYAAQNTVAAGSNAILNCIVDMQPEWYLEDSIVVIPRSDETCKGIELESFSGPNYNGAATYLGRNNKDYIASKLRNNTIKYNTINGGSHGISLTNSNINIINGNVVSGCSNYGIFLISCADSNWITKNIFYKSGYTGIHLSYGCDYNAIIKNEVKGVSTADGDGIKAYINCNFNRIADNNITEFSNIGIRATHGANENIFDNNLIIGLNGANQVGIKIMANTKDQYEAGLKYEDKLTANKNICNKNIISNTNIGMMIGDELKFAGSTIGNIPGKNIFNSVSKEYSLQ